jgi:hypothetical protein
MKGRKQLELDELGRGAGPLQAQKELLNHWAILQLKANRSYHLHFNNTIVKIQSQLKEGLLDCGNSRCYSDSSHRDSDSSSVSWYWWGYGQVEHCNIHWTTNSCCRLRRQGKPCCHSQLLPTNLRSTLSSPCCSMGRARILWVDSACWVHLSGAAGGRKLQTDCSCGGCGCQVQKFTFANSLPTTLHCRSLTPTSHRWLYL